MAQPVWVLSVDLQAKTATFQTGMSEAARSARGAFDEIGGAAGQGGRRVGSGMMEARHSVMLLGEEFGVHIPRALATFIAGLGPIGAAMEAAFPFLAIAVGATLLIEHLVKMHEAGEKLTEDQVKFGTAVNNAFNSLDNKILEAQKRADELRGDHLGALHKELELIDRQSMEELVKSFEEVARAADVVMKDLEGHWYTFGKGSDGAKHALDQFQTQYDSLLAQGKQEQASGLLHGTLQQAQQVLTALRDTESFRKQDVDDTTYQKGIQAAKVLQGIQVETGVSLTKQIEAQQNLVDALQAQVHMEGQVAALKKLDTSNASTQTGNDMAAMRAQADRQSIESQLRMGEQSLAGDKATADAQLDIRRASLEERLSVDLTFAARERDVQLAANAAEIAALDKSGKDYQNQLKALQERALEINNEYDVKTAELKAKASVEIANRDLQNLEQTEREKIEATQQGSAARLAAINAALKQEEDAHLQDTNFYRELLNMRVETTRQEAEEEGKLRADAAREDADNAEKMGELKIAAEKQAMALSNSTHRVSDQERLAQDTHIANEEYDIKMRALQREIAGLDKSGKDYLNKLKALQDQEKQLTQQHENETAAIREKAEIEMNNRVMAAAQRFNDSITQGLTQVLMRHESFAKMITSIGDQVVSGMIQNAIKEAEAAAIGKEADAAKAARKAYDIGVSVGGPVGMVLGPLFAALAFSTVTGYQSGTDAVPGVGKGDVVPTMLEPGEGVVPGGVMDGLRQVARNGGFNGGNTTVVHVRPTYHVNTIDGDGMQEALEKHTDQLQRHFENTVRRMNL